MVDPVIEEGVAGALPYTVNELFPVLPQELFGVTVKLPLINVPATFTFILVVPLPLVMVIPEGTVHT